MSVHEKPSISVRCRVFLFAVVLIAATSSVPAHEAKPPLARVDNVREVIHGVEIVDPYRWLEDDLDMIGYYRFKNNNPPALLEYGNTSDPAQFKYLYAYSPYQKVKAGEKYPAVLFTTGDQDTRVPPLQARKMSARLQAASTSGKPVLLLYDTKAGHAGGRPLSKIIEDVSLELSFLFWQLRIDQAVRTE